MDYAQAVSLFYLIGTRLLLIWLSLLAYYANYYLQRNVPTRFFKSIRLPLLRLILDLLLPLLPHPMLLLSHRLQRLPHAHRSRIPLLTMRKRNSDGVVAVG